MANPAKVVRLAIRDSIIGKPVSVYGPLMKAFWLLTKAVPHPWLLRVMTALS